MTIVETPRSVTRRGLMLCGFGLTLYAGSWLALGGLSGPPAGDLTVFVPGSAGGALDALVPLCAALSTAFVVLFLPGIGLIAGVERLPGLRLIKQRLSFEHPLEIIVASFLISIAIWVTAAMLLGGLIDVSPQPTNSPLYVGLIAGGLLMFVARPAMPYGMHRSNGAAVVSLVLIAMLVVIFREYLSFNVLSDDEVEAAQFALSLRDHRLPYWDLENGTWGFYPNFMLFAYPMFALTQALGQSEFAFRAPYFVSLLVAICGCGAILEHLLGRPPRLRELGLLTGAATHHQRRGTFLQLLASLSLRTGPAFGR